ncbi:MAG: hypothetical protein ACRC7P_07595, partial [Enterovibrio sp.]
MSHKDRLQDEVQAANDSVTDLEPRITKAKNEYLQAKDQAVRHADKLAGQQSALIKFLELQEKTSYDRSLTLKQALSCQPLLTDFGLEERKNLAKSILASTQQVIIDAKQCDKAGGAVVEQLERLVHISIHNLFINQSKEMAAAAKNWLGKFANDIEKLRAQQTEISVSGQWPENSLESIGQCRRLAQEAIYDFVETLQQHLEEQERQVKVGFAKIAALTEYDHERDEDSLSLSKYEHAFTEPERLESFVAANDAVLAFDAVHDWTKLSQSELCALRDCCQEACDKLNDLQPPELQQDLQWRCLVQGITDQFNVLSQYAIFTLNEVKCYGELIAEFKSSEDKLHSLCMKLRERNSKLEQPDFSPIYHGRGIRDYFSAQHQQRLEQVQARQAIESERV